MKRLRLSFTVALCLFALCFLSACSTGESLTAYQAGALHLRLSYDCNGVPAEAEVTLAAGDAGRDATVIFTAPAELSGLTLTRKGGICVAGVGNTEHPLPDTVAALAPLALFSIPESATVTGIEKDGDTRTATLACEGAVYTLRFSGDSPVPVYLSRSDGDTFLAATVTAVLP